MKIPPGLRNVIKIRESRLLEKGTTTRQEDSEKIERFPGQQPCVLLAAFYAARDSWRFSIGVKTPKLRCTRLVL